MKTLPQNWRAALAILVSVPPNMPGLINSINPKIGTGGIVRVFDLAWIFGVSDPLVILDIGAEPMVLFSASQPALCTTSHL